MGNSRLFVLLLGIAACASTSAAVEASAQTRPNVVVILVDDLGVEGIGCYGAESYETPAVDRLASSGMRFTSAHTTPLCTPTRVRLLTGREGLRSYVDFSILAPDEVSFAERMQAEGYATGVAGKWQLYGAKHYGARAGTGTRPEDAGFDSWCLWQVETLGPRYANPVLELDGQRRTLEGAYGPEVLCDWACEFIEEPRDEPFLLFLPLALTHGPFEPTPLSDHDGSDKQRCFVDMVAYMDLVVGRVVQALERAGLRDETLLVFAADNGSPRQIRSLFQDRELQGGKGRTTDAGTHVPLIVSWPGRIAPGESCDDLVDLMDVFPTVLEAAQVAPPADRVIDGRSLLPRLLGGGEPVREVLTCWYLPRPRAENALELRWARDARFKLYGDDRMYDLIDDPGELLALEEGSLDEAAREARTKLAAALAEMPAEPSKLARR